MIYAHRPDCFNSRPCERGDISTLCSTKDLLSFNSRPCERGDRLCVGFSWEELTVSIHAPARGATRKLFKKSLMDYRFNSRPCERGDSCFLRLVCGFDKFQFTPLREGRQY